MICLRPDGLYEIHTAAGEVLPAILESWWAARWYEISGEILPLVEAAERVNSMSRKVDFTNAVRALVAALAEAMDKSPDLYQRYFDEGYNSGGANPITDQDIAETGLTAAKLTSAITLIENLDKFFAGANPANAVYRITVNQVR